MEQWLILPIRMRLLFMLGLHKHHLQAEGAQGFCVTPGGFVAGSYGEFVVGTGVNYGLNSLTPGTVYYLDPTSTLGQVNSSAPVTAGQIKQVIGVAITNTQLLVQGLGNWTQL
jgi:hypothetical protein